MKPDRQLTQIYQDLIRLNNKIIKKEKVINQPAYSATSIVYSETSQL